MTTSTKKQVKIVRFPLAGVMMFEEQELTKLVNEGWQIVAAGGGGAGATYESQRLLYGFVVLQK